MAAADKPTGDQTPADADNVFVQRVELELEKKAAEAAVNAIKARIKAPDTQVVDDLADRGAKSVKLSYGPNVRRDDFHTLKVKAADWPEVHRLTGQALEVLDLFSLEVIPGEPGDPTESIKASLLEISAAWELPVDQLQDAARTIAEIGSLAKWTINPATLRSWWKEQREAAEEREEKATLPAPLAVYVEPFEEARVRVTNAAPRPTE